MQELIGTCELCGCTDHHLIDGVCATCTELHAGHMHTIGADAQPGGLTPEQLRANDAAFRNAREVPIDNRKPWDEELHRAHEEAFRIAREVPTAICPRCETRVMQHVIKYDICPWCRRDLAMANQAAGGKPA